MKFSSSDLRQMTKQGRLRMEQEKSRMAAEAKAKEEAERPAKEIAMEQARQRWLRLVISGLEENIERAANQGRNFVLVNSFDPHEVNVKQRERILGLAFGPRFPKTLSREYLPENYQVVYDYFRSAGLEISIEFVDGLSSRHRGDHYTMWLRW
jgi:hypothetical protein